MPPFSPRRRLAELNLRESLQLEEPANDGFWTPGMGEAGFDGATPTAPVLIPTMDNAAPTILYVTVTAEVEVAATTVTQLVQPLETTPLPSASSVPSDPSQPLFAGTSSPAVGKVLRPLPTAEAAATTSNPALASATETMSPAVQAPLSSAAVPAAREVASSVLEKVFNPKWDSQVRAVVPSTAQVENTTGPSSATSTSLAAPALLSPKASSVVSSGRIAVVAPSSPTSSAVASPSSVPTSSSILDADLSSSAIISPTTSSTFALIASSSDTTLTSMSSSPKVSVATSSATLDDTLSPSASAPSLPTSSTNARDSSAASFFSTLGKTPANIALTSIVCVGIVAVLFGAVAFFLRRCHRRRKKALLGDVLGSEGGDTPAPQDGWAEKFENEKDEGGKRGAAGGFAYLDAESPGVEPDEVWRRRLSSQDGHGSLQGDQRGALTLPARAAPDETSSVRRESDSSIDTDVLYHSFPSAGFPAFHLPNRLAAPALPAPILHQARPSLLPNLSSISDSVYSITIPPTPRSPSVYPYYPSAVPLSPGLGNLSPNTPAPPSPHNAPPPSPSYFAPRSEILAYATTTTPGIVRTLPSLSGPSGMGMNDPSPVSTPGPLWKESLERVMGSAAELLGSTFGATTASQASDEERGEFVQQYRKDGDRFTTFPATTPRRSPPTTFTTSTLRPTRPPPLNLSPTPRPLAHHNSHLSLMSTFSDSTTASSAGPISDSEALVSPSTLAFPDKALVQVEEHAHAAKGVRTNLAFLAAGKEKAEEKEKEKRPGLPRFEPRLMLLDEHRTQSEPGHDRVDGGEEDGEKRDSTSDIEQGEKDALPAINPFLDPRRPLHPSQRRPSHSLPRSTLSRPPLMARQRSSSLDNAGELVSPFAHPDDDSDSLDHTSSSSSSTHSHSDGDEALPRRARSEQDKRVSSLMLERRRRSLASLSAAGSPSLPGSRSGSVMSGSGGRKKGIEAELKALFPDSRF